ncbi:Hsp33 family molecular chaperone HslO [Bacillus infantis]|jgi:molecular chaperone Hsp33|uniref:Hsp33 family molecular chaperone HslO n=1 Tax=Bacillus infantis TaxID=324767 RepID=UPI001CD28308|nr:Hsp33 family molecular chaperone HslO [Bacillus infantis]MCA1041985.1 Hsp33 family molecular chaperone HslO [Bacillus infantis]
MKNQIIKTLIFNKQVRLYLINNSELINEILNINANSSKVIKMAVANSLSVISLLSATLKGEQRLSVTLTLSNPKSKIHADTDAYGNIKGYANEFLLSQDQDKYSTVKELIGLKGSIRMIKGVNMNQFTGITSMPYQDIDKDFSYYFKQSDQTDTLIKTNINLRENNEIKYSYGIYAQLLPQSSKNLLELVEENFKCLQPILENLSLSTEEEIINTLNQYFGEAEIIGHSATQFFCGCSKDMFFGLLHSIDKLELKEYVQSGTPIISTCQICGRNYIFNTEEIKPYLEESNG